MNQSEPDSDPPTLTDSGCGTPTHRLMLRPTNPPTPAATTGYRPNSAATHWLTNYGYDPPATAATRRPLNSGCNTPIHRPTDRPIHQIRLRTTPSSTPTRGLSNSSCPPSHRLRLWPTLVVTYRPTDSGCDPPAPTMTYRSTGSGCDPPIKQLWQLWQNVKLTDPPTSGATHRLTDPGCNSPTHYFPPESTDFIHI